MRRPCWKALHEDLKTQPPKRKAEEKALSVSKKPKVGPSPDGGTDSPVAWFKNLSGNHLKNEYIICFVHRHLMAMLVSPTTWAWLGMMATTLVRVGFLISPLAPSSCLASTSQHGFRDLMGLVIFVGFTKDFFKQCCIDYVMPPGYDSGDSEWHVRLANYRDGERSSGWPKLFAFSQHIFMNHFMEFFP